MSPDDPSLLLVDDDVDICANLADILADVGGYRVDVAHDGFTALEMARRKPYDVAVLDLKMPGMDGLTLYREIKLLRAGTVAILATAYASELARDEAGALGIWQIVDKPVDFPTLLGLLDEALGQPLILVVDDDRDLCQNLWDLLRENGYRVCLAYDVAEADARLEAGSFQVVMVDLKLPGGDGRDLLHRIRLTHPRSRTVLVTGYPDELGPRAGEAKAGPPDAVCLKPLDVPRLLQTLDQLSG